MKRPGLTPPFASATLFLIIAFASNVPAQEMMATGPAAKTKRVDELLKRYDKNGDGKIDDDERADAKEVMMKEQIERQMVRTTALPGGLEQFRTQALELFDRNRDGRLDDEERAAAQRFVAVRDEAAVNAAQLVKRFDRNGDGTLDAAEQAIAESFVDELRNLGASQARAALLRMFDRNADGKIAEDEFAEVEKFVRPRIEAAPVQLRWHDRNQDGRLDDAEWRVAKPAIQQWLNGSGAAAITADLSGPDSFRPGVDPVAEQKRLDAVAAEVARRRALREAAGGTSTPAK